jgi:hypothetical protein
VISVFRPLPRANPNSHHQQTFVPRTSIAFVSRASIESGTIASYNLRKRVEAVKNCRNIGKKDMKHNAVMPKMKVDPESYVSRSSSPFFPRFGREIWRRLTIPGRRGGWDGVHGRACDGVAAYAGVLCVLIRWGRRKRRMFIQGFCVDPVDLASIFCFSQRLNCCYGRIEYLSTPGPFARRQNAYIPSPLTHTTFLAYHPRQAR